MWKRQLATWPTGPDVGSKQMCAESEWMEMGWLKHTFSILRIFSGFRLTWLPM
jgi:hypothetical protein